jgi:polyisoprenoid-binding protein YceI
MALPTDKAISTKTWHIDPATSQIEFHAHMRLMFVAKVTVVGHFTQFEGTVTGTEGDPANAHVIVTISASSLDTKTGARDKHLRSADFFDVDHFPQLTFTSRHIEALDPTHRHYRVDGLLTIRDMTREVSMDAWAESQAPGEQRHTVNLTTEVDRRDFGLTWRSQVQQIADDVQITLHIQLVPVGQPA